MKWCSSNLSKSIEGGKERKLAQTFVTSKETLETIYFDYTTSCYEESILVSANGES